MNVSVEGADVHPGDRVRLRPRAREASIRSCSRGKVATVESIEQDYEGKTHVCVVVDDDPGRDIGLMRQPGHRFSSMLRKSTRWVKRTSSRAGCGNDFDPDRRYRQYFSGRRRLWSGSSEQARES